jgi:hypothetical protein
MIKIEPRVEYQAQEITARDFEPDPFPSPGEKPATHVPGVIYRDVTRTARLATDEELEDDGTVAAMDNAVDADEGRRPKRPRSDMHYEARGRGVQPPGKHSFYGIGCFIIVKNGRAIDIIGPEELREKYRLA